MAIEETAYSIIMKKDNDEVREYAESVVAEVAVAGSRFSAASAGFRILANYIFGGNDQSRSIAMTAPVVQSRQSSQFSAMTRPVTQVADDNGWIVRFSMPRGSSIHSLPIPIDDRVHLLKLPLTRYAAARFSGLAGEASIEKQTMHLKQFITDHHYQANGEPSLARYNPPWTLWFLRRNEILIPLHHSSLV